MMFRRKVSPRLAPVRFIFDQKDVHNDSMKVTYLVTAKFSEVSTRQDQTRTLTIHPLDLINFYNQNIEINKCLPYLSTADRMFLLTGESQIVNEEI
jgi:hypothetical protein